MLYSKQEWMKTRAEMNEVFADVPEALSNTVDICDQVEFYSIDNAPIMPTFAIPEDFGTEEGYRKKYTEKDLFDLGSIVHLDIRLQLLVFQIIALHIFHAYLRDTEHQGRVDLRFPPYGCHGSRNRGADQLADT